jgi:hypothetical protein
MQMVLAYLAFLAIMVFLKVHNCYRIYLPLQEKMDMDILYGLTEEIQVHKAGSHHAEGLVNPKVRAQKSKISYGFFVHALLG